MRGWIAFQSAWSRVFYQQSAKRGTIDVTTTKPTIAHTAKAEKSKRVTECLAELRYTATASTTILIAMPRVIAPRLLVASIMLIFPSPATRRLPKVTTYAAKGA
jgi:hypothetical protein